MSNKDGGSAFPRPMITDAVSMIDPGSRGMTLRQWYAGMALHGMVSNIDHYKPITDDHLTGIVGYSYALADLMIKKGEK